MPLEELLTLYVSTNTAITSDYTVKLLRASVKLYGDSLGHPALVVDLTDRNLKSYIVYRQNLGMAPATIEREACKILTLWRFASTRGMIPAPTVRLAHAQPHLPVAFLKHEVRALFKAAYRARGNIGGVPCRIFFPAILGVVWDSGERAGAVRALARTDIDLRGRWVTFRHRKGQGREMIKRVSRSTRRALKKLLAASQHEHPFAHVHLTTCYFHLKVILRDAGLPTDRRSMLHRLRRSHASYLKLAGGDSTASLGHSSDAVTSKFYHDPRVVRSRQPSSLLFNPHGWRNLWGLLG